MLSAESESPLATFSGQVITSSAHRDCTYDSFLICHGVLLVAEHEHNGHSKQLDTGSGASSI
jgi:hypothetical protein